MITTAGGASTNFVRRDWGSFPLNSGSWTIFSYFKYPTAVAPATNVTSLVLWAGATDYTKPYIFIGSGNGTNVLLVEAFNGTTTLDTASYTVADTTSHWYAVTYNSTTHIITLIVDGVSIGTITIDMSSVVFTNLFALADGNGNGDDCSIAYCRAWSSILTSVQLTAEAASITAVVTTGLIFDCPFQTSIDLTSHNNTLNQLIATGTVTTDTTDPLLSIVAGPPTNVDPNTATTVDYNSAVFQDTLTAGAATTVWHKATALTGDKVWGACAFGDLVTYKPSITVFDGLANALANSPLVTNNPNLPVQFPVTVGHTYYFKSTRNGAVTPAILQLSILRGLTLTVPVGSLAIPDVTSGFPLVFLDNVGGYPINWQTDFPPGEEVGIINSTNVLVEDSDTLGVKLYNNLGSALITTPAVAARFTTIGSNLLTFVAAKGFGGADQFVLVNAQGTVGATTYSIGAGGLHAITLNPDSTIAYIEQDVSSTNQPVKKFVLATSTLSTFVAGIANYILAPNLIGISDGTVLVGYNRAGIDAKILRYNADGTTANTYDLSADDQIERLALDINDESTDFWVWSQPTSQYSRFYKIKLSDGTHLTTINNVQKYDDGLYQAGASVLNTPVRFGHSFSCPLWITAVVVNNRSGLYYLTGTSSLLPTQRHDTVWVDPIAGTTENVAIP